MAKIKAVCISSEKGTAKKQTDRLSLIENFGAEGDAHGGSGHRQISMLPAEKITEAGFDVPFGAFGENIVTEGIEFTNMHVGTRIKAGDAVLEMTQIGKSCHKDCDIARVTGRCIMPSEGAFFRVIEPGTVRAGDEIKILGEADDAPYTAAVVVLSDSAASGKREDESGRLLEQMLTDAGYDVIENIVLSDDRKNIEKELKRLADQRQAAVVFTTGGTGFSPRDNTPEATEAVCDRMAPGIAEAIRYYSLQITPRAMLSRGTSGIRGRTLIINLAGSPKAVKESLEAVLPVIEHGIGILRGREHNCGEVKR